mmetsp:Transcript_72888/g.211019  ORF Transcript_72888/g.211019 Transcript_72888/m.211019 type:complete len:212 (-) Transcript_72888:389-1024(-)
MHARGTFIPRCSDTQFIREGKMCRGLDHSYANISAATGLMIVSAFSNSWPRCNHLFSIRGALCQSIIANKQYTPTWTSPSSTSHPLQASFGGASWNRGPAEMVIGPYDSSCASSTKSQVFNCRHSMKQLAAVRRLTFLAKSPNSNAAGFSSPSSSSSSPSTRIRDCKSFKTLTVCLCHLVPVCSPTASRSSSSSDSICSSFTNPKSPIPPA